MRVIVVEDNILFCDYICNFLQNADYQTVKAYRLAQARQVIARSVRRMTSCWRPETAGRGKHRAAGMDEGTGLYPSVHHDDEL
mgnify:CR=1 FL=1